MIIEDDQFTADEFALDMIREEDERRPPGLHVSHLVYCTHAAWRDYWGISYPGPAGLDKLRPLLGTAIHRLIQSSRAWGTVVRAEVNTSLVLLGQEIVGSVDGVGETIYEIKSTFANPDGTKAGPFVVNAHYIEQAATYAVSEGKLRALFMVWHVIQSRFRFIPVSWHLGELMNWRRELERRVSLIISGRDHPPSRSEHYDWEREYCGHYTGNGGLCPCAKGTREPFFKEEGRD